MELDIAEAQVKLATAGTDEMHQELRSLITKLRRVCSHGHLPVRETNLELTTHATVSELNQMTIVGRAHQGGPLAAGLGGAYDADVV